jgi:DNA anti-recombination protein RmuC
MKPSNRIILIFAVVFVSVFTSCKDSTEKVANAESDVAEAQEKLKEAESDYLIDVEKYKEQTAAKIDANNKSISDFNERIAKEKKAVKAEYKEKIAQLESKNTDMKKKIDEYKLEGKEKWSTFKTDFDKEMDELGKSINDVLAQKN